MARAARGEQADRLVRAQRERRDQQDCAQRGAANHAHGANRRPPGDGPRREQSGKNRAGEKQREQPTQGGRTRVHEPEGSAAPERHQPDEGAGVRGAVVLTASQTKAAPRKNTPTLIFVSARGRRSAP